MVGMDALAAGVNAFEQRQWAKAFAHLSAADEDTPLDAANLERLATVGYLIGEEAAWTGAWSRAHQLYVDAADAIGAVRCAFWLAFGFLNAGEMARGGGWLSRAQRLTEDHHMDSVETGYLLLPAAIESCDADPQASLATFLRASQIGEQFGDLNLVAIARHGQGRALIRLGQAAQGMAMLDEVLVWVTGGDLSPIVTGDVYCGAIEACQEVFDVRRAREWTSALSRWCDEQPDLVPYRGQCLVYRSAVRQAAGAWPEALDDVLLACKRLAEPTVHPAAGAAYYQRAELHRLRGEFSYAERAYRQADGYGHDPQPGFALLRLAQGDARSAVATIRRVLQEASDRLALSRMLPAAVEIFVASNQLKEARAACDRLQVIAGESASPFLEAVCLHGEGALLVAEERFRPALAVLRRAFAAFHGLGIPYAAARTRTLIGLCCLRLGDEDSARLEFGSAGQVFERLSAAADLAALARVSQADASAPSGLTARELDVLRLVAQGKTNRAIGDALVISEKTVARHISNIFSKLGVSTRAAATASAYDQGLVKTHT